MRIEGYVGIILTMKNDEYMIVDVYYMQEYL